MQETLIIAFNLPIIPILTSENGYHLYLYWNLFFISFGFFFFFKVRFLATSIYKFRFTYWIRYSYTRQIESKNCATKVGIFIWTKKGFSFFFKKSPFSVLGMGFWGVFWTGRTGRTSLTRPPKGETFSKRVLWWHGVLLAFRLPCLRLLFVRTWMARIVW